MAWAGDCHPDSACYIERYLSELVIPEEMLGLAKTKWISKGWILLLLFSCDLSTWLQPCGWDSIAVVSISPCCEDEEDCKQALGPLVWKFSSLLKVNSSQFMLLPIFWWCWYHNCTIQLRVPELEQLASTSQNAGSLWRAPYRQWTRLMCQPRTVITWGRGTVCP